MVWAIFGSGVVVTLLTVMYTLIIWLGEWSTATEMARVNFLGGGLLIAWFAIIVVVVTFGLGGPLGRLKGKVGGVEIEAQGDADIVINKNTGE